MEHCPGAFARSPAGDGEGREFCSRCGNLGSGGRPSPLPAFFSCDRRFQACVGLTACRLLFQGAASARPTTAGDAAGVPSADRI
eukprot:12487315-Alexandrium_andersonii.AAC.1